MEEMKKETILVVDDVPENIEFLDGLLNDKYNIVAATSGKSALKNINSANPPDLVLLDIIMPDMDGYEVCRKIKENISTRSIPVIFITAKDDDFDEYMGFEAGGVDYIKKPISPPVVLARIKTHLALSNQNKYLERLVVQRTEEIAKTEIAIIEKLGRAVEFKDNETGVHVMRMSRFAYCIAKAYGMGDHECELIKNAAPMHDIGKIGVPDVILTNKGPLNEEQWKYIKKHPEIGAKIIGTEPLELIEAARIVALQHHEKWDGTGYPFGLKETDIHKYARIVAIADVFDALISERPYKTAWTFEEAVEQIKKESGTHFDPKIVEAFLNTLPQLKEVIEEYNAYL